MGEGYGLSKAALTTLTMIHAKKYPNLMVTSLSPGFIDTPMTKGFGAKLVIFPKISVLRTHESIHMYSNMFIL